MTDLVSESVMQKPPVCSVQGDSLVVSYWSEFHNTWMEADIAEPDVSGLCKTLLHDIGANRDCPKMRKNPTKRLSVGHAGSPREQPRPSSDVNFASGGSHSSRARGACQANSSKTKAPVRSSGHSSKTVFNVGDAVEYWSDTYRQWVLAAVQRIRKNGDEQLYDLDVKGGRPCSHRAHKIRPCSHREIVAEKAVSSSCASLGLGRSDSTFEESNGARRPRCSSPRASRGSEATSLRPGLNSARGSPAYVSSAPTPARRRSCSAAGRARSNSPDRCVATARASRRSDIGLRSPRGSAVMAASPRAAKSEWAFSPEPEPSPAFGEPARHHTLGGQACRIIQDLEDALPRCMESNNGPVVKRENGAGFALAASIRNQLSSVDNGHVEFMQVLRQRLATVHDLKCAWKSGDQAVVLTKLAECNMDESSSTFARLKNHLDTVARVHSCLGITQNSPIVASRASLGSSCREDRAMDRDGINNAR